MRWEDRGLDLETILLTFIFGSYHDGLSFNVWTCLCRKHIQLEVGQPLTSGHKGHSGCKARKFGMKSIQKRPATFPWRDQSTKYLMTESDYESGVLVN
jgi:hypothetical protein